MVCYGPSKGCKNCRARKIKCDEGRPSCYQCTKSKKTCLGYDKSIGVSFRDETRQVERRVGKKRKRNANNPKDASCGDDRFKTYDVESSAHSSSTFPRPRTWRPMGTNADEEARTADTTLLGVNQFSFLSENVSPLHSPRSFSNKLAVHSRPSNSGTPSHELDPVALYPSRPTSSIGYKSEVDVPIDPALTDASSTYAIQNVAQGLPQDLEQQSLCFFMTKFVQDSRREEIWGGCLQVLPVLYQDTSISSALSSATMATAMGSMAWDPNCSRFKPTSLSKYVLSLKRINDAVQDPKEAKSDSTLMAVLMLGFYENIKTLTLQRSARESHTKGAVALIKGRSPQSFHNKTSLRLYLAVRAQLLGQCIENADPRPIEDFHQATKGALPPDFLPSYADYLVILSMDVAQLRFQERFMLAQTDPTMKIALATSLLHAARQAEQRVASWSLCLPQDFRYSSVPLRIGSNDGGFNFANNLFPERMDIYSNSTTASTWNSWRTARIYLHQIIMACADILEPPQGSFHPSPDYIGSLVVIRQLVDNICSSIPFHLGHHKKDQSSPGFNDYPHPPGRAKWPENFAASGAVGGWLMMSPLSFVCRLGAGVVEREQREWMLEYLTTFMRGPKDGHKKAMDIP